MEKQKILIIIAAILLLAGIFSLSFYKNQSLTTFAILDNKHYTTAICNDTNYCRDYEIVCVNKTIVSITPITGGVQYPLDWNDSRDKANMTNVCE